MTPAIKLPILCVSLVQGVWNVMQSVVSTFSYTAIALACTNSGPAVLEGATYIYPGFTAGQQISTPNTIVCEGLLFIEAGRPIAFSPNSVTETKNLLQALSIMATQRYQANFNSNWQFQMTSEIVYGPPQVKTILGEVRKPDLCSLPCHFQRVFMCGMGILGFRIRV